MKIAASFLFGAELPFTVLRESGDPVCRTCMNTRLDSACAGE